jgi:hypothetical protein
MNRTIPLSVSLRTYLLISRSSRGNQLMCDLVEANPAHHCSSNVVTIGQSQSGATLRLALPWLAATLNTDIATLAPLALLTLVLAGVAWIWREPLANFAWRLICQGAPRMFGATISCAYRKATGVVMNQYPDSFLTLSKRPSAFLPMVMSIAALSTVLASIVASSGAVVRDADEGAVAHIWQLLMAGQVPMLAYFVIRWLPRAPRPTIYVFALQIVAALAAMAPVYLLGL